MPAKTAPQKPKKKSGGAILRDAGRSPILVAVDPDQKQKIRIAAAAEGLPMSQFLLKCGLTEAAKIIGNL